MTHKKPYESFRSTIYSIDSTLLGMYLYAKYFAERKSCSHIFTLLGLNTSQFLVFNVNMFRK